MIIFQTRYDDESLTRGDLLQGIVLAWLSHNFTRDSSRYTEIFNQSATHHDDTECKLIKTLLKWNSSHRKGSWYIWWWLKIHDQGTSPFQAWLITETSLKIQNIFLEDPNQQPLPLCMKFLKLSVLYDDCSQGGRNCANAWTWTLCCDDIKTFKLLFQEYVKKGSHIFANTRLMKELKASIPFVESLPTSATLAIGGTKNTNFQNLMGALSNPISFAKNTQNGRFGGYQKWHLGCPNQNSKTTFSI